MKRVNFRLFALAIALVAASCVKDVIVDDNFIGTPSEKICFGAELKDSGEDTRSGVSSNRVGKHDLTSADGEFVLPMGVYVEDGIRSANGDAAETRGALFTNAGAINEFAVWAKHKVGNNVSGFFNNVVYEKNTTDNVFYSTGEEYFWPGDGELTFVALTNAPDSGFVPNYTAGSDGKDMLESFTYTVPADATAQNDIILAKAIYSGSYEASAPLKFEHIMSAVNVKIGSVTNGTIESITLKGVYNKGTYNVAANRWYPDKTSTADYTVKFSGGGNSFVVNNTASGTTVNASDATFMFIPQEPGEAAVLEVVFNNGQKTSTLTGAIAGDNWEKGRTVNYNLSIDENLTMIIAPVGKKLDAHYIIAQAEVTVDGFGNNDTWTISVSDSKNESTILPKEEMNPLALQGFWTDKYVDANGNVTSESARGTASWQGTGNVSKKMFYIFITENITGADKEVKLTLKSDKNTAIKNEKVLLQKCPNWVDGGFGWETVDDDETGKYGFKWTRKVAYLYPYTKVTSSDRNKLVNYCQTFIDSYGAGKNDFATVSSLRIDWDPGTGLFDINWGYRAYILLDYSVLNSVEGADSETEGYDNTLALYRAAGTIATSQFETILKTTLKDDPGSGSPELFRLPSEYEISNGMPGETGQSNDLSAIMEYIQKKNRYYVYKKSHSDGEGTAITTYIPHFNEADLLWYLPAKNQFQDFVPNPDIEGDSKANYWSSTTAGTTTAWTGGPEEKDRDLVYQVIAVRKNVNNIAPATIDEINTEEMAGGENGEAQWVE